jgi:hypothetical protein
VLHQHLPVLQDMYLLVVFVKLVQVLQHLVYLDVQLKVLILDLLHVFYVMQMLQVVVLILQHQDVTPVISYHLQILVLHVHLELVLVHLQLILLHVELDISKDQAQLVVLVVGMVLQPVYLLHKQPLVVPVII